MSLIDKIKAIAKEGIDFNEIEGEISALNPLANVKDKNQAWDFIKGNDLLLSVLDQKVTERANTTLDNFKSGKMEDLIKEREESLRREFNPKETPEQIQIRELLADKDERLKKEARRDLEDKLLIKAKELDFDPIKAKDYSIYGDSAIDKLESDAGWFNTMLEERTGAKIKEKYSGDFQPKAKVPTGGISTLSDSELNALAMAHPEQKVEILAEIKNRVNK